MAASISNLRFSGTRGKTSGALGVAFTGFGPVLSALDSKGPVFARVQEGAKRVMIDAANEVLAQAMDKAPIDEGTLRASGYATVYVNGKRVAGQHARATNAETGAPIAKGKLSEAAEAGTQISHTTTTSTPTKEGLGNDVVGVVGFNTPYALEQHERTDFVHPKGGQAKYLEEPVKDMSGRILDELRGEMAEALR